MTRISVCLINTGVKALCIQEDFHEGSALYAEQMRQRVADTFRQATQIAELKGLLTKIRASSGALRALFLTEEELREMYGITADFDKRMQTEVQNVTHNLETYHQYRWKELLDEGEDGDE